ncbi:hypothetical protein L1987_17594 [Smallanthus sonchifolius]|uniref:Uncharacterized protein n=1 Tax=Smallanthus sonchifolius TaxID=185202 RepID=A0ACB9IZK5_9ASTR|nr:hypothetical protein L1987_17594 [Smallanthus sonchifolius]
MYNCLQRASTQVFDETVKDLGVLLQGSNASIADGNLSFEHATLLVNHGRKINEENNVIRSNHAFKCWVVESEGDWVPSNPSPSGDSNVPSKCVVEEEVHIPRKEVIDRMEFAYGSPLNQQVIDLDVHQENNGIEGQIISDKVLSSPSKSVEKLSNSSYVGSILENSLLFKPATPSSPTGISSDVPKQDHFVRNEGIPLDGANVTTESVATESNAYNDVETEVRDTLEVGEFTGFHMHECSHLVKQNTQLEEMKLHGYCIEMLEEFDRVGEERPLLEVEKDSVEEYKLK